jgi:hypothetical protein
MPFLTDNTPSATVARGIYAATLDTMQNADELGGPEAPEYIELMEALAEECAKRAATARENFPSMLDALRLAFPEGKTDILWTGGGCRALALYVGGGGAYWMITDSGGASVPDTADEPCGVGFYSRDGDDWVCFDVADFAAAIALIRSYANHQFSGEFE